MEIHFAVSFCTIAVLISCSSAFQFRTGHCPEVKAMKDFEMNRFLGVWHVVQGTLTGYPTECITFNVTRADSNHLILTQLPHNLSSVLTARDKANPSKMSINLNTSSIAHFYVLVTDYENFAGFFICENSGEESFQRAAAILSRTKILSTEHYDLVKQHFKENGVYAEDLTSIILCD